MTSAVGGGRGVRIPKADSITDKLRGFGNNKMGKGVHKSENFEVVLADVSVALVQICLRKTNLRVKKQSV